MSFTLASVKTSLQARGYGTDTTSAQTEFTKAVLRRIYSERPWRFLNRTNSGITVAVGASTVSLSTITDLQGGKIKGVRLVPSSGDTLEMEEIPWEELRKYDAADSSNDTPLYYARQDNTTLQLWPRPNWTYTVVVDYVLLPALPALDTDTITFPDEHMDVIVDGLAVLMASRQRDWPARDRWKQDFDDSYAKFARAQGMGSAQSPAQMGRWIGWDQVAT